MHPDVPREGDLSWIDWTKECVWRQGEAVHLTPKAWAVLRALTAQPGQVVPKAALLEAVWPDAVVSEAVLTECIRVLRQAFGETARAPHWIQTVHRRGYRFLGPVPEPVLDVRGALPAPGGWPAAIPSAPLPRGAPASAVPAPRVATLVGRAAELAQLHQRLAQAQSGTRQVVFVTGEPGLGKSTLVQAFVAEVAAMGGVWIASGQCLEQYGAREAYLPVLEALGRVCRAPGGAALLTVLEHQAPLWLTQMPGLLSVAALEAAQRWGLGATPARMVREMADALDTFTQDHALVLVLEDLHWSDVATLDLLAALAQRPRPARLLVLGTYRPVDVIVHAHPLKALAQALAIHGQCTDLPLELLTTAEVAQYLAARCAVAEPLAAPFQALAGTLSQRTVGNPLFLVTMVDDLIRQGLLRQAAGQWVVEAGSVEALRGMPGSLRRMLIQQYDELSAPDQQLVDAASVAGMTWSAATLAAGLEVDVEVVEARGADLVQRGQWLAAQGLESWPDGTVAACYRWQHPLYQEVVYERLPAGRRLRLHRCMGARLAAGYGAHAGMQAAALADHFVRGRDAARAVPYLLQAAQNALQRQGYQEALGHLHTAVALLRQLPDSPTGVQQELALLLALGRALVPTQGFAAPEVVQVYQQARTLCQQVRETLDLFPVLFGLRTLAEVQGDLPTSQALGGQLLALAQGRQ